MNCVRFGFALLRSDWPLFQPMKTKTKRAFSRALRRLHEIASNSDWLTELSSSLVIGQSNCFGFSTQLDTALSFVPLIMALFVSTLLL